MSFETALRLVMLGYHMRCIYWPVEDYLRRTHKSEPHHPSIVRIRGRLSDDAPAIEYKPFLTKEACTSAWVFAKREGEIE